MTAKKVTKKVAKKVTKKVAKKNNFREMINEIESAKRNLNNDLLGIIQDFQNHLKLSNLSLDEEQEYDDNNYFTAKSIQNIFGIDDVEFDLADVKINHYSIDEEFNEALEEMEQLEPSSSLKFIKGSKKKHDLISYEDVGDINHGKLMLYCLKNDINIGELKEFLIAVLEADNSALPASYFA